MLCLFRLIINRSAAGLGSRLLIVPIWSDLFYDALWLEDTTLCKVCASRLSVRRPVGLYKKLALLQPLQASLLLCGCECCHSYHVGEAPAMTCSFGYSLSVVLQHPGSNILKFLCGS